MKPGIPWSVKGIEPEAREAAKQAARRAGLSLGEWLNGVIFDQSAHNVATNQADALAWENFVSSSPPPSEPSRPDPSLRPYSARAAADRRDDSALRLQDIAQQLADLAQRERQSAPPPQPSYSPERSRAEREEFERIVERIDENERQTVEALTAVNERLTRLGQQIAQLGRPSSFDRPEDVPGYSALESAIRNVVEHIEVSERRTRDSLKSMQDRLGEMAERGAFSPTGEDMLRAAPVLAGLESRLSDMLNRIHRQEGLMSERFEGMRASAQQMANQAQSSAVTAARGELREVETRMLASLKEAQAAAANAPSLIANEIAKLHGDMAGLARRLDDVKAGTASERDLQSLRGALEQLSARVAQGADMRPLADMDQRLGDINRRLEAAAAASREGPQVGALEQRIAELDHRLAEAMRLQGDQRAMRQLEESLAAVNARVAQTEQQLGHLETMEQAIRQLYDSLEQTRVSVGDAAEAAASRALERYQPPPQPGASGPSPELRALEDGLRAVRESIAGVERRNQDTFEAVHETLAEIVDKIAEFEAAPRAGAAASPVGQASAYQSAAEPFRPEPAAEPEPEDAMDTGHTAAQDSLAGGDDFIAAARRAAQAAATRPSALRAEYAVLTQPAPEPKQGSLSFLQRFRRKPAEAAAARPLREPSMSSAQSSAAAMPSRAPVAAAKVSRKTLIVAGLVLLVSIAALAYRNLSAPPAPEPAKQSLNFAAPAPRKVAAMAPLPMPAPSAAPAKVGLLTQPVDPIVTGSLPPGSLAKTIPTTLPSRLEKPPPETGTEALRTAAAAGDPRAQFIIAGRYLDGQGVAPDFGKAFYWYQQSAARGLAPAQYRLATLFELGKGVAADPVQALVWYERAAQGGNVKAMHNAAVLAAGDKAGQPNFDKAFRWFKAAAERGFGDSEFNLAILYERGLGTQPSMTDAYVWYSLAAKQGDPDSGQRAAILAKNLPDADLRAADLRLAAWLPTPADDSGNVVTIIDPAWKSASATSVVRQSS